MQNEFAILIVDYDIPRNHNLAPLVYLNYVDATQSSTGFMQFSMSEAESPILAPPASDPLQDGYSFAYWTMDDRIFS